jgi:Spy/CpxP family protein refolding chaperone
MNTSTKNRWQVRVAAIVIFVLGFVAGALALNIYRGYARNVAPRDRFEQLSERLKLNADQKTKVQQIFGETREQLRTLRKESEPKVNDIRKQADDKMQQVLTPDQWKQFQTIRDEMRERRSRGRS